MCLLKYIIIITITTTRPLLTTTSKSLTATPPRLPHLPPDFSTTRHLLIPLVVGVDDDLLHFEATPEDAVDMAYGGVGLLLALYPAPLVLIRQKWHYDIVTRLPD